MKLTGHTGRSFSEVLILATTNPQYDKRLSIKLPIQYMKISSSEHFFFLVFNRGDTVSRRSPIEGVRPLEIWITTSPSLFIYFHSFIYLFTYLFIFLIFYLSGGGEISFGERRGAAYGLAGFVKGLGILSLKQLDIMGKLTNAVTDKKQPKARLF